MKIGLISFHNAYNYGAALQAYALQKRIESMDIECEYINYVNKKRAQSYDMNYQFRDALKQKKYKRAFRVLVGTPFINSRGKRFEKFYEKYVKKTKKIYHSSKEASELNDYYEKFIVGSDQVWNNEHNGNDCAFLLDFVKEPSKKISYASSFGIDVIPDDLIENYKSCIESIGKLSVREKSGVDMIKKLTGREASLVLDPVFLISVKEWKKIKSKRKKGKPYVFFYTNNNHQMRDFLKTGFSVKGLESHVLSTHISIKDFIKTKTKVSMSPEEFLQEIYNSEFVVTASFHCVAFSIIFHKQFCAILTGQPGRDERIKNLLKITGLENRILTDNTKLEDLQKKIDYTDVEEKLKTYREYSQKYLVSAILSKEN